MDDAIKKVKQLAASALARKESLEGRLVALQEEKVERSRQRDLAERSGDDGVALSIQTLMVDLDAQISAKQAEIAEADATFREIMGDLDATKQAKDDYARNRLRAPVDAALYPDPFSTAPEDLALDNVRRNIETLAAQAELEDDLATTRNQERDLSRKIAELDQKDKADKALAQLAELKAKRKPKDAGEAKVQSEPTDPEPPKKPKKTM